MLDREESIEQAYFFRTLRERLPENMPLQDLLAQLRHEVLATTKLPMAVDFLLSELKHAGVIGPAMKRLAHYFTPFQAYLVTEAESEQGRFDMRIALEILEREAEYRSRDATRAGSFLYQFETLCRNRLRYDRGLDAMAADPAFDKDWSDWIKTVRRQVGLIDMGDMLFARSEYSLEVRRRQGEQDPEADRPLLFGPREGKIALANRQKDPLLLFAALQRQLGYPQVPRMQPADQTPELIPQLLRRMERLEARIKMMEEEQRSGAIDLTKFYEGRRPPGPAENP
jgi:hypothetical protein